MKKSKKLGLLNICIGAIFLFNPNINVIDILPDFIGYFFILAGISMSADLVPELDMARDAFKRLVWISLAHIPALAFLLWINTSFVSEKTMTLVLSFSFAVVECFFVLRAFRMLFDGLNYLAVRYDGENAFHYPARNVRSADYIVNLTYAFVIAKYALSTLPDFVYLSGYDSVGTISLESSDALGFRPLLIGFSFLLCLFISVPWLVSFIKYICHTANDKKMISSATEEYEKSVAPKTNMFAARRICTAAVLLASSSVFVLDMYIDEINILPDFISGILFIIGISMLGKYIKNTLAAKISAAVYTVCSAVTFGAMIWFENFYSYSNVAKSRTAANLFAVYEWANIVQQIAFLVMIVFTLFVLYRVVFEFTGYNGISEFSSKKELLHKAFRRKLIASGILSVFAAASSIVYLHFVVDTEAMKLRQTVYSEATVIYMPTFEAIWMIDFAVGLLFAAFTANMIIDISTEVKNKYRFDI